MFYVFGLHMYVAPARLLSGILGLVERMYLQPCKLSSSCECMYYESGETALIVSSRSMPVTNMPNGFTNWLAIPAKSA
jgi:hypothetical protein